MGGPRARSGARRPTLRAENHGKNSSGRAGAKMFFRLTQEGTQGRAWLIGDRPLRSPGRAGLGGPPAIATINFVSRLPVSCPLFPPTGGTGGPGGYTQAPENIRGVPPFLLVPPLLYRGLVRIVRMVRARGPPGHTYLGTHRKWGVRGGTGVRFAVFASPSKYLGCTPWPYPPRAVPRLGAMPSFPRPVSSAVVEVGWWPFFGGVGGWIVGGGGVEPVVLLGFCLLGP